MCEETSRNWLRVCSSREQQHLNLVLLGGPDPVVRGSGTQDPDEPQTKKLFTESAWPPKLQIMCNPDSLFDIRKFVLQLALWQALQGRMENAVWLVVSQCRSTALR